MLWIFKAVLDVLDDVSEGFFYVRLVIGISYGRFGGSVFGKNVIV
jgi:hypothetical protein